MTNPKCAAKIVFLDREKYQDITFYCDEVEFQDGFCLMVRRTHPPMDYCVNSAIIASVCVVPNE